MKSGAILSLRIVRPLSLLAIALIVSCTLVGISIHKSDLARLAWETEQNRLFASRRQLEEVHLEKARIAETIRTLALWRKRGLIGSENQLAWIDTVQKSARSVGNPEIRFRFEGRKASANVSAKELAWQASTMHLSFNGIDEVRLLQIIERIEAGASAEVIVRACDMKRSPNANEAPASLAADCTLDWLTIGQPAERT